MKKFLISLLLVCLTLSSLGGLVSCKDEEAPDIYTVLEGTTQPTRIVSRTRYVASDAGGEELVLEGSFDTKIEGANAITEFSYQRLALPEEMAEERILTLTGTSWIKDGVPGQIGDAVDEDALPEAAVSAISLSKAKLERLNVTVSEDGKTLTASIPASAAAATLGVAVVASGNVTLTVKTNGVHVTGVTLSYLTLGGASVTVETSYSYNTLTLVFPEVQ